MSNWNFPGAKWWKFDFHAHTPASADFIDRDDVSCEDWLREYMMKGIDCVAVTDHNSGAWIDKLKQTLLELIEQDPEWYRPLNLFPGIEISANGGVHILAIFDPEKTTSDIDSLLGAVGYEGTKGSSDGVTKKSPTEVIDLIVHFGGIAIPAHVDKEKGLFSIKGQSLQQILENFNIRALELCDENFPKPELYNSTKTNWTEVIGSDFHGKSIDVFTWVKMGSPCIEGLRLALIDGIASINRDMEAKPNRHAEFVIEKIIVKKAKYMGRPEALTCEFSPFLSSIIGGRGTGKSTLLEFMRFALRRDQEIPEVLQQESGKYFNVGGQNLLTENSQISLIYRKEGARYRLNWSAKADIPSLHGEENGNWTPVPGEIKSLFPARIYSQKQIFELARNPRALIDIVDEAPEVENATANYQHKELVNRYKQLEQMLQELGEKIAQENRLRGEFSDLIRQSGRIEKSGHKAVLQNYRKRQQQLNEIENLESDWQEMIRRISKMRDEISPARFNERYFIGHDDILSVLRKSNEKWRAIRHKLSDLVIDAQSIVEDWKHDKNKAAWMQTLKAGMAQYEQLRTQLEGQSIDPQKYPLLLLKQKKLKKELQQIEADQSRQARLETEKKKVLSQIEENRKALSKNRQSFLTRVLQNNSSVSIEVRPFGQTWDSLEKDIRRILQCPDRFDKDIENLKNVYHADGGKKIEKIKLAVAKIHSGEERAKDARFINHLRSLPQESLSDFKLWFPGDDLKITYGPNNEQIEQGSPGQKTAALLAFILSYGDEPLLLDQPEDDLDNELIYSLIVQQLRKTKSKRQVIVVTHNANIVVNGDSEMVHYLNVTNGRSHLKSDSLQSEAIRQRICDTMEGGSKAFEQRYRRIHLEKENA